MGLENNIPEEWVDSIFGKLPKDWGVVEIDNIADVTKLAGFEYSEYFEYVEDGEIIALRALNAKNGMLDLKNIKRIRKTVSDQLPRSKLIKNDILFTYTGTIGEFALIPDNNKYHLAPNVCLIRCNQNFDVYFLYSFFRTTKFKKLVEGFINGSTQGTIPMGNIRQFSIISPPLTEQKAIAKVLTAFDDKIELLQAQIKTLETMAQTIFKEWFGKYQIGDDLPEGWSVGEIYNVLDVQYGYPFKSKLFNENKEGLPLIRIRDIRKGVTGFYTTEAYEKEYIISSGDVLAGMDAVFQPYLWSGGKGLLNQRSCRFIPKDFVSRIFVFEFMKPHLSFYEKTKVGTTVIHLGKGDLDFIETVIPDKESLLKFKDLTTPIEEKIINNQQEIQFLTKTRDTLLPKLMSGQVRVNNIKQTANA